VCLGWRRWARDQGLRKGQSGELSSHRALTLGVPSSRRCGLLGDARALVVLGQTVQEG